MADPRKNENPSKPIVEDVDETKTPEPVPAGASGVPEESNNSFNDNPERIQGWITHLEGVGASEEEIKQYRDRLEELKK